MNPFFLPNDDKNALLREKKDHLELWYVLPCPKHFPKKSFVSKKRGTSYYRLGLDIPYQNNMSKAISEAYYKLKVHMMLELALYKRKKLNEKIDILYQNATQLKLF